MRETTAIRYEAHLEWTGGAAGTASYAAYSRDYRIGFDGKPDLEGSADPAFRGSADRHNPEDLFVAALSACHMLAYLALCARSSVRVLEYTDHATGTLTLDSRGGGRFDSVLLRPEVVVEDGADSERALALHDMAHERCFIASSVSVPVQYQAVVRAVAR